MQMFAAVQRMSPTIQGSATQSLFFVHFPFEILRPKNAYIHLLIQQC
jgi:hypothetical protein